MGVASSVISAAGTLGAAAVNAAASSGLTEKARRENYYYNEMSAQNADARTRALYTDLYSPKAQIEQLREAGLSPSVYYDGGAAGMSGQTGAQGAGTQGPVPNPFYIDPLSMAQIANIMADTKVKEEEAENLSSDTEKKDAEAAYQRMTNEIFGAQATILTGEFTDDDGNETSAYELAGDFYDFDDYLKYMRENNLAGKNDAEVSILRDIYRTRSQFSRDIAILSEEKISADFQKSVIAEMSKSDFANLNAKAACAQLRANVQTAELTEQQKEAWNNLLHDIERKHGTTAKNVTIILSMFLNNALQKYHMPSIINKEYQHTTNNNVNL